MDDDQQVAVLLQLNLNSTAGDNSLNVSWDGSIGSGAHDISVIEASGSGQQYQKSKNLENNNNLIQKDLEFIRKHLNDADPDFILSLLHSQIDNPNRLETVMCDILNIPNALELIQEFRRSVEDKHSTMDSNSESSQTGDTTAYLQQIRDMFPDADGLFLISECQQLKSWEDFSRFVNTVMLSGVYPKKGVMEQSDKLDSPKVVYVTNTSNYRTVENVSSEEEISSSGLIEIPRKKRKQQKKTKHSDSSSGSLSEIEVIAKKLAPPDIDVIDLASDNTEPYEPPDHETLNEMFTWRKTVNEPMEIVEEVPPVILKPLESSLVEEIGNLLETKFGPSKSALNIPNASTPRPRLSLPGSAPQINSDDSLGEKSLAEIIEEKRNVRSRRSSLTSASLPSTSRTNEVGSPLPREELEVSCPEVSTSQPAQQGSETEGGFEEGEDSPKISEQWLAEQTANLIRIFPNTDPSYLREEIAKMNGSPEAVNAFVEAKLEKNDMPTRAEYEKKLEMEELQNRYTNNFSIEDFLKIVPEPWNYFTQGNRNCAKYKSHSLCYLKSAFRKRHVRDIIDVFNSNNSNLYLSYKELKKETTKRRRSRRSEFECNHNRPTTIDIQFLQEVAFIENEEKIKDYLEGEKIARQIKFDEAKRTGSLLECQCCFDSEVLVEDIFYCPKDHAFCRNCIIRSVEVEMGYGRFKFECLSSCDERFTLSCLQNVLKPELFSKVIQAIQMEEIRAAGIEDLVQCPFCNYATIMPPEEKVMTCLNPECLKESCRMCKELNHIPLRCDEIEKSEEVKMRTYIENKMTEALVRTCHKCGKKFVKEDGCNKMTCTCGAKMCYVCRKPVTNYSHFNGQGGTEYHKCPLYSTNDELHVDLVNQVAERAKAEILQQNPQTKLLHDPTAILPKRTNQNPMPGVNRGAALDVAMRAIMGAVGHAENEPGIHRRQRERRGLRQEANPYYNRYHRHRHQVQSDSDEEEEEGRHNRNHIQNPNNNNNHLHHHHHHHHHHHNHHRHGAHYHHH